jgi:polysaccharide export outer membrane protein
MASKASHVTWRILTVVLVGGLSAGVLAQQATQSSTDTTRPVTPMRPSPSDGSAADPQPVPDPTHGAIIAPRDALTVTTLNNPAFTVKAIVDGDGTFDFGYLGRVKAAGLTARQLESDLKKRLDPDWVKSPQVTVELVQSASKRVLVGGRVRNPSSYPFAGRITVLDALLDAGSIADDAGERAFIIRANSDGGVPSADQMSDAAKVYVDLHALLDAGDLSQNYTLNDGDYLFVEKAQPFTITGEVKNAGMYPVRHGLTVQQAVALAGGLTDKGKSGGIKILRPTSDPKKPLEIEVKNDKDYRTQPVRPGDTIIVPSKIL